MVFVGTLAPLIARRARACTPISVGLAWFTRCSRSSMLPLVALVSIGIHAAWKRGQLGESRRRMLHRIRRRAWCSVSRMVYRRYGPGKWLTPIGIVLGIWIIVSSLFDPIDRCAAGSRCRAPSSA